MHDTSVGHGDGKRAVGCAAHVSLNGFPDIKNFAPTKGSDVVNALKQNAILESVANCSGVIFDASCKLVGG